MEGCEDCEGYETQAERKRRIYTRGDMSEIDDERYVSGWSRSFSPTCRLADSPSHRLADSVPYMSLGLFEVGGGFAEGVHNEV
jgi:hypothetical protein